MSTKKSMSDIWAYFEEVDAVNNNVYANGHWGQFVNGKQGFDCVNIIKAVNWCVPINVDITPNQYDYIADHKDVMPDVDIAHFYNNASVKSTDMTTIPTDVYSFVYQNNGHIGIYNPETKECYEMCGGGVQKVRRQLLSNYSNGYWNKWSNAYYFENSEAEPAHNLTSGFFDTLSATPNVPKSLTLTGWAWNGYDDETVNVVIKIFRGMTEIGMIVTPAGNYRADLEKAGIGNGKHGFFVNYNYSALEDGDYIFKAYAYDGTKLINDHEFTVKTEKTIFRVQLGAYRLKSNAKRRANDARSKGLSAIGKYNTPYYKVQVGAYENEQFALAMLDKCKALGYSDAFITTENGQDVEL